MRVENGDLLVPDFAGNALISFLFYLKGYSEETAVIIAHDRIKDFHCSYERMARGI